MILDIYIILGKWHISCFGRFQSQKGGKAALQIPTELLNSKPRQIDKEVLNHVFTNTSTVPQTGVNPQ